jgi:hypothetical protein
VRSLHILNVEDHRRLPRERPDETLNEATRPLMPADNGKAGATSKLRRSDFRYDELFESANLWLVSPVEGPLLGAL